MFARAIWCVLALAPAVPQAQSAATVREVRRSFTTYPFDDPDPVPRVGRIYPYFRFDGFTNRAESRTFTVVELENAWLRVSILPEIGGKIWNAIDKSTGRSLLYDNKVVKFRDVAMRGPWTSGGIEANYGIIGHTPNVATPVDYTTRRNPDGSVSCIIGALDLLTRTPWRLEITLPADKAYFTTTSFWYNAQSLEQPYYTWMNAAIPVGDDLEFIYAGNRFLGHDGEVGDWPTNTANGKAIRFYRQNDFGGYKSYHVFGTYTDFFGAWWHNANAGMVRYAAHDEKPGKKLWIWGLSRQGMIWEQLLTDADGQYAEVQSGRLFNQTGEGSTRTPFKHRGFAPHSSERWTEYWYPVRNIGGMVAASQWGALNVQAQEGRARVLFYAAQPVRDTLRVTVADRLVAQRALSLRTADTVSLVLPAGVDLAHLHVTLGVGRLEYHADPAATALSRPLTSPPDFDWSTAWGHYLLGKEKLRDREFGAARDAFTLSLAREPGFVPALGELASLTLRHGNADSAVALARRALAIDTYDPLSNYVFGLASRTLGRLVDARDGLDIASQSVELRAAAYAELAHLYLAQRDHERAVAYAQKALAYDANALAPLQVIAVVARSRRDPAELRATLSRLDAIDPLSHFVRAERWLHQPTPAAATALRSALRSEMPQESLLELALWYHQVNRDADADAVLGQSPLHPETLYWRAWFASRLGHANVDRLLAQARELSPTRVFPFRVESEAVLAWARQRNPAWQTTYYLALVRAHNGNPTGARALLESLGDTSTFAPLFALRAQLRDVGDGAARDWQRAMTLDPSEWRYGRMVAEAWLQKGNADSAAAVARRYLQPGRSRPSLDLLYARALLRSGRTSDVVAFMDRLEVLPAEGASDAHAVYREANLLSAVDRLNARDHAGALAQIDRARAWPERLGSGKPYPADVDERLEDWLAVRALELAGEQARATALLNGIAGYRGRPAAGDTLTALARARLGLATGPGTRARPDNVVSRVLRALSPER